MKEVKHRKMICINAYACKDEMCPHKEEHTKNLQCETFCAYLMSVGKTCIVVERKKQDDKYIGTSRRRITNPKLPVRKKSSKTVHNTKSANKK